jgi:microsomal dipeptidase-like Zn-dependent dipeptidase
MTALRATGLSASDVAKVAGGNMQRVLSQVIG